MRPLLLSIMFVGIVICASAAPSIPPFLVGTWRKSVEQTLYIRSDGIVLVVVSPVRGNGSGYKCLATYDSESRVLSLSPRLSREQKEKWVKQPSEVRLSYDEKNLILTSKEEIGVYKRVAATLPPALDVRGQQEPLDRSE